MPCKQVAPTGDQRPPFRTGYKTEAECNQACKEGACCEGGVCSVKPQCQCQKAGQTFKGIGTTCSPNPCGQTCCTATGDVRPGSGCQWCWCFCGEGSAPYPRFINVSLNIDYILGRVVNSVAGSTQEGKDATTAASITLAAESVPGKGNCPAWKYGSLSGPFLPIGAGEGAVRVVAAYKTSTSTAFNVEILFRDFSGVDPANPFSGWRTGAGNGSSYVDSKTEFAIAAGPQSSGVCFNDISGVAFSKTMEIGVASGTLPIIAGRSNMVWRLNIVGVQS